MSDASIAISIQSGNSESTLVSLADKTRALDKESQLLKQTSDALTKANQPLMKEQTRLQSEMKESQKVVDALRKAYKESGDDMTKQSLDRAIEEHAKLKTELSEVNAQIGANQKTYKEYLETVRKGTLNDYGSGSLGGGDSTLSIGQVLDGLGIGQQLSSLAEQAGGALLSSALGSDMGGLASNALSSAISGASLGTAIAPGIGTAIGAALGGLSGLAGGAIEQWTSRDEAFKDYYGGLYEDVRGRSGEMVGEGSTIAGGREQTRMALSQRFGSEQSALDYLAEVEELAAKTNYEYDEIVGYTKLLLNSYKAKTEANEDGSKETDVLDVLMALSDATAGLDLGSSDVNMMISGLSRMRTTGKATQEYLNYFRERGIDTDQALVDFYQAQGKSVKKSAVAEMVSKGKVGGEDAAQAILDFIQDEFGGLSDTLAGTYDAMVDNLGDITTSLQAQGGEAYNALRKEGVEAEMNALGGELGNAISEINRVMGENQARKENVQDQYMREILGTVLNGTHGELWSTFSEKQREDLSNMAQEFANWSQKYEKSGRTDKEAGAQMEALYEAAQATAQAYFDNSDFMQILNDTELDEIQVIRENTAGLSEATQASYRLSQELSKGWGAIRLSSGAGYRSVAPTASQSKDAENTLAAWRADPDSVTGEQVVAAQLVQADTMAAGRRNAFGLNRVPYDEYPALLHEGERVLTASEARAQDAGQAGIPPIQLTITGNYFTGTPEEMADQLAEIIVRKVVQAATAAAPK